MKKKVLLGFFIFYLLINIDTNNLVMAGTVYEQTGDVFSGPPVYHNASPNDYYLINFNGKNVKKYYVASYDSSFTTVGTEKWSIVPNSGAYYTSFKFTCNTYYIFRAYDGNDNLLGTLRFHASSIANGTCDSTGDNENNYEGGSDDCGCVFNTPAWNDYMGKIDEIIGAIPPPPNWNNVADTFRDSIVPQVITDLDNMLGRAPTPPSAPSAPTPPPQPPNLDDRGIQAPTGQAIPKGGEFTENDIKNQAPIIQEREDPTGGFKINNPIDALPDIEEFKKNIPNEGEADLPNPPKELEYKAPQPPEQSNPAPTPDEGSNTAPMPNEGSHTAPKPNEGSNTAPIPGGDYGTPPTPNESGTAPMPGNDFGSFPMPNG